MHISSRKIGGNAPPYVIAEIGVNHDGEISRAEELVHGASIAGADAVKFQWFRANDLVVHGADAAGYQKAGGASDQRLMLQGLELDSSDMARVCEQAHSLGMHAIVTVFCESLVSEARAVDWDAWKVASPDLVHRPLLESLKADGRPIILSTGASSLQEVRRAHAWLIDSETCFLQCVSAYPAKESEASLAGIDVLAGETGRPCGYSDHTTEESTGGLAVAAGAKILEKHFTYSRSAHGPDHSASMTEEAFSRYIAFAHRAHRAMGPEGKKVPHTSESDVKQVARQSLRAARALPLGHPITLDDLVIKRPADGMEPWKMDHVLGRTLRRPLGCEEAIRSEDLT